MIICTELLRTNLRTDGTPKNMSDVIAEAKTMESAQNTNKLITNISKGIEKTVHWTAPSRLKKRHSEMKLKHEPNTCHWCGDPRGPHSWSGCPTKDTCATGVVEMTTSKG